MALFLFSTRIWFIGQVTFLLHLHLSFGVFCANNVLFVKLLLFSSDIKKLQLR